MKRFLLLAAPAVLAGGLLIAAGCHHKDTNSQTAVVKSDTIGKTAVAVIKPAAAAATQPTQGNVTGTVTFTQEADGLKVVADLTGFPPNTTHGFHVHAKGDLTAPDLSSAGGHFDPTGKHHHGGPDSADHHPGDLGNLTSNDQGNCKQELTVKGLSLSGEMSIIGKSVIIHAKPDDLATDPSGNSGARVAGGVIEAK